VCVKKDIIIEKGTAFEELWDLPKGVNLQDLQVFLPFQLKDDKGHVVQEFFLNNGYTFFKYDADGDTKFVLAAYETEELPEGMFYYSHDVTTGDGTVIKTIEGTISIINPERESLPPKRPVKPWDFLKSKSAGSMGERSSDEEAEKRISICQGCPRFVKATTQCLECGCIMKLKTKLKQASCPIGKW